MERSESAQISKIKERLDVQYDERIYVLKLVNIKKKSTATVSEYASKIKQLSPSAEANDASEAILIVLFVNRYTVRRQSLSGMPRSNVSVRTYRIVHCVVPQPKAIAGLTNSKEDINDFGDDGRYEPSYGTILLFENGKTELGMVSVTKGVGNIVHGEECTGRLHIT
ncbi:hypothetical protein RF11_14126 [Thelohanellus kitauei]|uniref:Retrotransposon gag domain-containing protein n=1 Tax=Thelohanellus kitauei TaxID=669202 RepID=A0A0C2JY77_THEKT|nr:hypothetical protein RF11_06360 [Thelohanellus kitauei]KII74448.1 hypothetical protein RF11_14126 [Thelohanellus kitauei]